MVKFEKVIPSHLCGGGLGRGGKCQPETLTRISKFTLFIKKFNPLTVREAKNNVIASESEAIQTMVINNNKTKKEGQMNRNKNHDITKKDIGQIMNGLKQSDVVIHITRIINNCPS